MSKKLLKLLFIIFLIPIYSIGQIPKGHFVDADNTTKNGYKLKPFKQEKEGIFHYAILGFQKRNEFIVQSRF